VSRFVYVGGTKGGCGKTTTAHLLCLGAILARQPATYVLTDSMRKPKPEGRPYGVIDGKDPAVLSQIITNSAQMGNGWLIVDGGGNRPAFDVEMAGLADLTLLPFGDDDEMREVVKADMERLPHALAWPVNWPSNRLAATEAQRHIDDIVQAFPLRVIQPPIAEVRATKELLNKQLANPATQVRAAGRRAYGIMTDHYDEVARAQTKAQPASLLG
jgi:chromosome partitioning protein